MTAGRPIAFKPMIRRWSVLLVIAALAWAQAGVAGATPRDETFLDKALIHPDRPRSVDVTPDAETLRRMVGRMLVVGFLGSSADDPEVRLLARQVETGVVGGVLILARNVSSASEIKRLLGHLKGRSAHSGFVVAVDQEGGRIQRLGARIGFPETASAHNIAIGGAVAAEKAYARMAEALAEWGFNLNLGPVVDLDLAPGSAIISRLGRSYSDDPSVVSAFAGAFVRAHRDHRVGTALKHFPGHGSSELDTHRRSVDISLTWTDEELEPYRTLAAIGLVDAVMVGHLMLPVPGGSDSSLPLSLDADAIGGWLRPMVGKDVVVITDDLDMAAVRETHTAQEAIEAAIRAGNDLIIHANTFNHDPMLAANAVELLVAAAMNDAGLLDKIVAANRRLDRAAWLQPDGSQEAAPRGPESPPE